MKNKNIICGATLVACVCAGYMVYTYNTHIKHTLPLFNACVDNGADAPRCGLIDSKGKAVTSLAYSEIEKYPDIWLGTKDKSTDVLNSEGVVIANIPDNNVHKVGDNLNSQEKLTAKQSP